MSILTLLVVVAAVATIVSLVTGISSMALTDEAGHRNSAEWMTWRVVFQAAAFILIMLALLLEPR